MALYHCGHPDCQGHQSFSQNCASAVVADYPALTAFQKLLDSQPLTPVKDEIPVRVPKTTAARSYSLYWRER